jgi:hypothetical protein
MGGFQTLPNAIEAAPMVPTPEQTKFSDETLEDSVALNMVIADIGNASAFVQSKAHPTEQNYIDDLYRAVPVVRKWEGSNEARSHLSMPLVLEVVESLLPQIFLGFFSDRTPFQLTAKGVTKQNAARAASKVCKWAITAAGFKEEIRKILKSCLLYGNGVGKWGWSITTEREREYTKGEDGGIVSTTKEVKRSVPTFEYVELGNLLVDGSLRTQDIRDSRYVIRQKFVTAEDLDEMRSDERYKNIPSRAQLKTFLSNLNEPTQDSFISLHVETWRRQQAEIQRNSTSVNPLSQPLEILEYETEDRIITILQRTLVLRNDENEYDQLSYVSCAFIDVLKSFWGLGIGHLLDGEQRLESGVVNAWVDSLNLTLSPSFHRKKGVGPSAQNIKVAPGRVINDDGELAPLVIQSVTQEALQAIQSSEARARKRVGANFGADMPNQAMRTAEGVQQFTASAQTQVQYFIEQFAELVFNPTLHAFIALCKDNLSPEEIDDILTDEEGQEFEGEHLDIYQGKYNIEVLSSTKLAAKRAMVSLAPTLMQFFAAGPVQQAFMVQNKKLDMAAFTEDLLDIAGWDFNDLIVDMTPEDGQRAMQQNPAIIKMQSDMALQNQKGQQAQDLEQTKGDVRGGIQVVKHILDQSGAHDEAARGLMSNLLASPQAPLSNQAPPGPPAQ